MLNISTDTKIISLVDPQILSIEIEENSEELIDIIDQSDILFGPSPEIPDNTDYTKMRKTVYLKLLEAQKNLPLGFKLCLYEGYRSLDLQKKLFEDRYNLVNSNNPTMEHNEIFWETAKLVSPVTNLDGSRNIPPHSTGAAIDVYLVDSNGEIIDMGIRAADWMQDIDGSISKTNSSIISLTAKHNRQIMSDALTKAGFVNYLGEYWHWSYGDRYWAYFSQKSKAIYGTIL